MPAASFRQLPWLALLSLSLAVPVSGRTPADTGGQTPAPQHGQARPADGQRGGGQRTGPPAPIEVSWEWWKDADVMKELGLSPDKSKRLDNFYNQRQRQWKSFADEFLRQRDLLWKMTAERLVDDDTYQLQVSNVENLRSKLNETRTVMLYRMYRELSLEQYQKLRELSDRRFRRGRGAGSGA